MPTTTSAVDRLTEIAKDALYIGVGAGVIAFQRAQVQRVELTAALEHRFAQVADVARAVTTTAGGQFARIDEQATAIEARVDDVLDVVQHRLPKPAATVLDQARRSARATRTHVRELLTS